MKHLHSKFIVILVIIGMMLTSGSGVFAASPNDQVIGAIEGSSLSSTYAELTRSFLRDTGKVLTQDQADSIIGNINAADAILVASGGTGTAAQAWAIEAQFEAACTTAGFTVSDVSRLADGGFKATISDPVSGKYVTLQANAARVTWTSSGVASSGATSSGTTMVAKTGLDNSLFLLAGVLALATVGTGVIVYRKRAIQ